MYALIVNFFVLTFCLDVKPGIHKCKITARLTLGIVSNVLPPGENTRPLPLYKFQIVFDTKYLEIFILFATCKKLGPNYLHKHVLRLAKLTLILFIFEWIFILNIFTILDDRRFPCVPFTFRCFRDCIHVGIQNFISANTNDVIFVVQFLKIGIFCRLFITFCKTLNAQQDNFMCFQKKSTSVNKYSQHVATLISMYFLLV